MNAAVSDEVLPRASLRLTSIADAALRISARFWFLVAVAGQWTFVAYILGFYGVAAVQGNLTAWNGVLPHGYVPGETLGNFALAGHLLFAAIITVGGPLQLVPLIRARFPRFHRWNGRTYIFTAVTMAVTGLYLSSSGRTTAGDASQGLGIGINAILILIFAALALRHAIARNFVTHRRWALRLFLVVSGVWFFRVGLMFWFTLHQGRPVGLTLDPFAGPFLTFLAFAQYLLPLAILELYFRTQDHAGAAGRFAMAAGLVVLTLAMGVGIFTATVGMWLPRISGS
jgi:hypothetical protein